MVIIVPSTRSDARRLLQHRRRHRRRRHLPRQVPQEHIPQTSGFWEKYFFKPGDLGYPVFQTRYATIGVYICYDRHFPEGARALGLNGAEIVFNPSATVAGLSQYLWKLEQPAHAVANGYYVGAINRVGTEAPWNIGKFYGTSYFVEPARQDPRRGLEDKTSSSSPTSTSTMIDEVRRTWQFYRDPPPRRLRREAMDAVIRARQEGLLVYVETCPQYLLLDDSVYDKPDFEGAAYVMSPPIRPKGHQEVLWHALAAGLIHHVATDHCPFNQADQKIAGKDDFTKIPNGAAGIENRLALMYTYGVATGRLTLQQFVDVCCTQPAKIFGLYPRKGAIRVGADADIVVYDPARSGTISAATHHHRCDRNIFEGFPLHGGVSHTLVGGRLAYKDGDLRVTRGAGRYLPRR
jgi:hypothetical protein